MQLGGCIANQTAENEAPQAYEQATNNIKAIAAPDEAYKASCLACSCLAELKVKRDQRGVSSGKPTTTKKTTTKMVGALELPP